MSAGDKGGFLVDPGGGGGFTEDAPRPPVPGEEGELVCGDGGRHHHHPYRHTYVHSSDGLKGGGEASVASSTPRRPDLDLGYEPEGSASPTPPYLRWAESLHALLDDQDGIQLFRGFLRQEGCADLLDFWFACSGFRKLGAAADVAEDRKLKLAKAICRKYVLDNGGVVSRQVKAPTRGFVRDCVTRLPVDAAMFDQAQTEVLAAMEENAYPLFLESDVYLEYTRTGGESPKPCVGVEQGGVGAGGAGAAGLLAGYLPTLNEDEEWRCDREREGEGRPGGGGGAPAQSGLLAQKLLMEAAPPAPQRVAAAPGKRLQDGQEFRHAPWRDPVSPYVNTGYAAAPVTSANDSERQSSDADTLSQTDSSVDGVPPYRYRRQHRREMHESAKANGRVPLPHIPRTNRIPKDIHVEPEKFAAELVSRLEAVLREREAQEKLEERLKRVRLEEEGDDGDVSTAATSLAGHRLPPGAHHHHHPPQQQPHHHPNPPRYADANYHGLLLRDAHEENPESILDDHVQRVMRTPGCQSPGATGHPYHHKHATHHAHGGGGGAGGGAGGGEGGLPWGAEQNHYGSKSSRNFADGVGPPHPSVDPLGYSSKGAALCKRGLKKGEEARPYDPPGPLEEVERNQKILMWMMEGEKEAVRHKKSPYGSITGSKKGPGHEASRLGSVERPGAVHPWISAQLRNNVQPSHPFIQDPTMPPNPAPNPLTQLEEARRRLEEEKKKSGTAQTKQRHKAPKRLPCENITVAYYFCGEPIPYRTSVRGRSVSLGQFKELLTKKGSYRYYFKKVSDEFDCGVVFEEVREDDAALPVFEEKIIGKVEKVD